MSGVPLGTPLLRAATGEPLLYGTLGAVFHLESLRPEDEPALAEVHALVDAWIGGELRWSLCSAVGEIERFRPGDFELVTSYPEQLVVEHEDPNDAAQVAAASYLAAASRTEFGLACKGADDEASGSPYTYDFLAEIFDEPATPLLRTCAVLRFTVPAAWPLADFHERVCAIAARLRLRWGAAGLMYSSWDSSGFAQDIDDAVYAHARRYSGYDTGYHVTHLADWHERIRTVNWLTFLGGDLVARLEAAGGEVASADPSVEVFSVGSSLMMRAGAQPDPGDVNRSRLPRPYMLADAIVRPVRAGADKSFYGRWTETTTVSWLKRFEKRLS